MNTPIIAPSRTAAALRNLVKKITGPAPEAEPSTPSQPVDKSFRSLRSFPSFSAPSPTRIGKIARLPGPIRSELNHRLRNGQPAHKILSWLNALPEVQQVLAEHFGSKPIHKVNLTHWRNGGFQEDEQRHRELEQLKALTAFTFELSKSGHQHLSNGTLTLANLKMLQHLRAMQNELDLAELHKIIRSAATIRRAEISQERSQTAKGMLRCRKRLTRVAERKLKHQIRQDRRNYHAPETFHPNTMTFEEVLDAALQPPPDYTPEPPTPNDATDANDGRARSPSAPCDENRSAVSTETKPTPSNAEINAPSDDAMANAALSSLLSERSALGESALPAKETSPAPIIEERQQSYWANPISMSNQPPTSLPAEPKPAPAQPLPPNRLTPEQEAELNLVKADQERCRAKYRSAEYRYKFLPRPWEKYTVFNGS